jgi:orotate phosphoribosyltransferase
VNFNSLAKALLEMGALRLGDFTLQNGRRSFYDIDLRLIPSYPDTYTTVLAAFVELVEGVGASKFDTIAGVATAGVTISSPLAIMLKKPMMYVRKQGEGRGQDGLLEGISAPGSRVLIIDDLVSTGTSIVSAAGALRKKGYRVTDAAVLVDRLEGGKENLATIGVNLSSYASIKNLLQALRQMKLAKSSQVKAILEQAGAHRRAQKAIGSP